MANTARVPGSPGTLVFSHANGFPAGTYGLLFERWRALGFKVLFVPRYGHDPAYPVTDNWPRLRDQLLALIKSQSPGEAVHLVGHSLGGYVSLLAASRQPTAVRSVILLDSPVVAGWRAHGLQVFKATGLAKRISPGRVSSRRRWQWPSQAEALRHLASKAVFARWDPRVLADYVHSGTESDPDAPAEGESPQAVRLSFKREIETTLYNTLPHNLDSLLRTYPVRAPVTFIGGTRSDEVHQVGLEATRRICHNRLEWIAGTHLFPMEHPIETAELVAKLLRKH